jgi:small conductance mechanosensitive channel
MAQLLAVPPAAPAADAPVDPKFDSSLDDVIKTLQDDQQRAALVESLKKIQTARQAVTEGAAPSTASGLLGAISAGIDAIQSQVDDGSGARAYWNRRLQKSGREWDALMANPPQPWPDEIRHFFIVLGIWIGVALLLFSPVRWIERRLGLPVPPPPGTSTWRILGFLLVRVLPSLAAFLVTVELARQRQQETGPSLGRTLALVLAYAYVGGAIFTSAVMLLVSLFGGGHRRPALRVLARGGPWLLFAIGIAGALGDAMRNARAEQLLGLNLAALAATVANGVAALLAAFFVIAKRRPIAHIIRNRPYALRQSQPFATQLLSFCAAFWHLPMLLLILVSMGVTLASPANSEMALRRAIITALLLVLTFLATALVVRRGAVGPEASRRAPYVQRFRLFGHVILGLILWLGWVELTGRIWGSSVFAFMHDSPLGQRMAKSLGGIGGTLLIAWFLWIVLDTAIQRAIAPSNSLRGRGPSLRARTVLPMVRNFTFITILTIGVIVTLANLGLNVAPLLAGAGVIGLAIGFGAQTLVKDLITGIFMLIEDTMAIGDWVVIDGKSGNVESLTIRTVRLRDGDGSLHSIPFSSITTVKNQSREFGYAVFSVRISYESDVDEASRLIRDVGAELQADAWLKRDILAPLELWGLDRFENGAVVLQGRIKTRPQKQSDIMRAFNRRLKERFDSTLNVNFASGAQILRLEGGRQVPLTDEESAPRESQSEASPQPGGSSA